MEGEIITRLEHAMSEGDQYDMAEYLGTAEQIAEQKLQMYTSLLENIKNFRQKFGHEMTRGTSTATGSTGNLRSQYKDLS